MTFSGRWHAKRVATEEHIRELETTGRAGQRYTAHMPGMLFAIFSIICDIGWVVLFVWGIRIAINPFIAERAGVFNMVLIKVMLVAIVVGVAYTIHLGLIHEKEIALRHQRDLSYGLIVLAGVLGVLVGLVGMSLIALTAGLFDVAGSLPIYLSFKRGIVYGIK